MTIELVDKEDVYNETLTRKEYRNILAQQKGYKGEAEQCKIKRWEQGKQNPICIAKGSPTHKGIYIGERYIHKYIENIFGDIEVMPYGNPGFDFRIKKSGLKIQLEVRGLYKSQYSSDNTLHQWKFTHINYNKQADIFILVGVTDLDIDYPDIKHIWLFEKDIIIRGYPFWYRDSFSIADNVDILYEYRNYEMPILKLVEIIDEFKKDDENIKRDKEIIDFQINSKIEDNRNNLIDDIISKRITNIDYRSNYLELQIMQRYLAKYFDNLKLENRNTLYNVLGIDKTGKEIKIFHIGRNLSFANNCNYSRYSIHIDKNNKTDYFVISLWKDKSSTLPEKVLLIHKDDIIRGERFWNRTSITITNNHKKLNEFKRFEINI